MRKETNIIFNEYFDDKEKILLKEFSKIYKFRPRNTDCHMQIWKYDQSITGLGGYACPLDVIQNPFNNLKEYRNVFRSLQYARNNIYI